MAIHTTYSDSRENLAKLLDRVTGDREVVFIRGRGREKVALVASDELEGLMETAHLLRSTRNATRLLTALRRALRGGGEPESVTKLRRDLGLDGAE